MCELFAVSSRYPAEVRFCLDEFARHGGLTAPHRDGWGVAYYAEDGAVRLYKEPEPASRSDWVRFIEQHHLRSTAVLSHIRRATQGPPGLKNTQPFHRELGGRFHVFAHNGDLPGLEALPELGLGFHRPVGDTDSEYAFCALLSQLHGLWSSAVDPPALEKRFAVVTRFARTLGRLGMANFIYADGDAVFAHGNMRQERQSAEPRPPGLRRFAETSSRSSLSPRPADWLRPAGAPGLFVLDRDCATSGSEFCAQGLQISSGPDRQEMTLVASVPLTSEPWRPLGEGEVLALYGGRVAESTS